MKSYRLCCGRGGCPSLRDNEDGTFTITDDFGGEVKLTKEELKQLQSLKVI